MISVLNHLLPLNGNKVIWLFPLIIGMVSCKSSQKSVSDQLIPIAPTLTPELSIDTISWIVKERKSINFTPYPSDLEIAKIKSKLNNSKYLDEYSISLLLPFMSSRISSDDMTFNNRLTALSFHFYNGFKLGIQKHKGISLHVFDTEGNSEIVESKLKSDPKILNSNLIVGPYRTVSINKVNEFANLFNIPFVSAFSAGADLEGQNNFYIKINPGLDIHFKKQLEHALKTFSKEELLFVGFEGTPEKNATNLFADIFNRDFQDTVQPFFISEDDALKSDANIPVDTINLHQMAVFVPSWSNQTFISSLLRNLSLLQSDSFSIRVYGMPQWLDFDFIDYEYFEKLNVHISSVSFIDRNDQKVKDFQKKYFDEFGIIPEKDAFLAFDLANYFGNILKNYGNVFQYSLPYLPQEGIQINCQIKPVFTVDMEGNSLINRWENQDIHILKFINYNFFKDYLLDEGGKTEKN
ncbi:MAG: hypothetical protein RJA52_953 [Bacteroidota bacterium]